MSAAAIADGSAPDRSRVEPELADLLARRGRAQQLPSWTRPGRARQSGAYLSPLKGRGMEYAESRPYEPGDDVRALDWRVTARSGKPHTKLFREERERPVFICVDLRPGMAFATRGVFKSVQAARAAMVLAWKAHLEGDRVAGFVFTGQTHRELPPARGLPAVLRLAGHLVECGRLPESFAAHETAPAAAVARLRRLARPGSLVIACSDFRGWRDEDLQELAALARHTEVMIVFVYDAFEAALPELAARGRISDGVRELEIGFGDAAANRRYAEHHVARRSRLAAFCRERGLRWAELATDADPVRVLQRAFGGRA